MLNFIYGRAATGKTYETLRRIKEATQNGERVIFIVPEQYSFESERSVLNLLGDKEAHMVSVLSFSSLADTLNNLCGGKSRRVLTDSDKILFMNKALISLKDELVLWRKYLSSPGFASKIVDMIGEFKISAVFPHDLEKAASQLSQSFLKEKVESLALIYRTYDAMLKGRFIDPADKLEKLYNDLSLNKYFVGSTVFIDGFKGFTGQQYRIIDAILSQSNSLTVTALCEKDGENVKEIYSNTYEAVKNIKDIASRHRVKIGEEIYLSKPFYETKTMVEVEGVLSGNINCACENDENIGFLVAKTVNDEVAFTARNIRRLVREKGYRYRDFVIIAREPEKYETAIEREFANYDISCFFDKRIPLINSPIFSFVDSALSCAQSINSDEFFRFLKTGLATDLTTEEISELENYVYLWNIQSLGFESQWDMDPTGFSETKAENSDEIKETLKRLNLLREKALEPLLLLRRLYGQTVREKAYAIAKLFEFSKTNEKMKVLLSYMEKDFSPEDINAFRQSWDLFMSLLDGMVRCFGDDVVSSVQFKEMLTISCQTTTVGRIPQMLDEVTFGAADRIRPSRPKVAFILGANQGEFPKAPDNNSILGNSERNTLIKAGLKVRNKTLFLTLEENLLVYSCTCCPSQMLFICSSQTGTDGSSKEPSILFESLCNSFNNAKVYYEPSEELLIENLPETRDSAMQMLYRFAQLNKKGASTLIDAAITDAEKREELKNIVSSSQVYNRSLSAEKAKKLYGNNIPMSATRFDTFFGCHFRYFCKYGLNTSIIQPAKLDVMQRGTIVHFVLEQFCNNHLDDIGSVSSQQIIDETKKYIMDYFSSIKGSETLFDERFTFLVEKIKEAIIEVIGRIVDEFSQSKFKPEKCEVSIGNNGTIPTVTFPFGENSKLSLYGSIDRLDRWGSYIRIVDYKTGSKTFKLSDTVYGLNMQMLLYLYCVIRGENPDYKGKNPAGILYLPSKRDLNKSGIAMNGIICANSDVVTAMESENEGKYIPKFKINKDGSPSKSNTAFIPEEAFDTIFDHIENLAKKMGEELHGGDISAIPVESGDYSACKYCDYKTVCLKGENVPSKKVEAFKNDEVFAIMRGEENNEV